MITEEFGPEQVKAEHEAQEEDRAEKVKEINEAIEKYTPVIFHWLKRAYTSGFNSTCDNVEDGFKTFCKLNSIK